jgi:hypothetical protein
MVDPRPTMTGVGQRFGRSVNQSGKISRRMANQVDRGTGRIVFALMDAMNFLRISSNKAYGSDP